MTKRKSKKSVQQNKKKQEKISKSRKETNKVKKLFAGGVITLTSLVLGTSFLSHTNQNFYEREQQNRHENLYHDVLYKSNPSERYAEWMKHYDKQGIDVDELKKRSSSISKIVDEYISSEKYKEKVSASVRKLLREKKYYQNYTKENIMIAYSESPTQRMFKEKYNDIITNHFKGYLDVKNYITKNEKKLLLEEDDILSQIILNFSYFLARKNFKSSYKSIMTEIDMENVIQERTGNCHFLSLITQTLYSVIMKDLRRYDLLEKISLVQGIVIPKKEKDKPHLGHAWLQFNGEKETKILETNSTKHNSLFGQKFYPTKSYLPGQAEDVYYVPLTSLTFYLKENTFLEKIKVHILPLEIEKELNRSN